MGGCKRPGGQEVLTRQPGRRAEKAVTLERHLDLVPREAHRRRGRRRLGRQKAERR